jgi:hypothetical protein
LSGWHESDALAEECSGFLQDAGWADSGLSGGIWPEDIYPSEMTRYIDAYSGLYRLPLNPLWIPSHNLSLDRLIRVPPSADFALRARTARATLGQPLLRRRLNARIPIRP